jgi:hypothetical protein
LKNMKRYSFQVSSTTSQQLYQFFSFGWHESWWTSCDCCSSYSWSHARESSFILFIFIGVWSDILQALMTRWSESTALHNQLSSCWCLQSIKNWFSCSSWI